MPFLDDLHEAPWESDGVSMWNCTDFPDDGVCLWNGKGRMIVSDTHMRFYGPLILNAKILTHCMLC